MGDTAWIDNAKVEDVATWPTKKDLRDQLHVVDKTIERWVGKGLLRSVPRRMAGEKSRPCYHPEDVRVLMGEVVEVVPVASTQATSSTEQSVITDISDRRDIVTQVKEIATNLTSTDIKIVLKSLLSLSLSHKTYLSLKEASVLSGLSDDDLLLLVHAGKLHAMRKGKGGRYKFSRAEIEASRLDALACLPGMSAVSDRSDVS